MATNATARVTRAQRAALLHGVYVIVNESGSALELAVAVLDAGVRIVQYRAKQGIVAEHLAALRALTRQAGALLILNDDWQAATQFDCDGVHLGPDDVGFAQIASVRAAIGERLIGLSCGTTQEARRAGRDDVDYVGVGSVFPTATKSDAGEPIGIEGLRRVASATALPVAAIGGITAANVTAIRRSGVAMAAVISAVARDDARRAARELIGLWNSPRNTRGAP
jgi:thiamine-phosphate pyrophosphorylase